MEFISDHLSPPRHITIEKHADKSDSSFQNDRMLSLFYPTRSGGDCTDPVPVRIAWSPGCGNITKVDPIVTGSHYFNLILHKAIFNFSVDQKLIH